MSRLAIALALLFSAAVSAAPRVAGSAPELGAVGAAWNAQNGALLHDDGIAPDAVAGDGIFSAAVTFAASGLVEYKISRNGLDLNDGGVGTATNKNLRFTLPTTNTLVSFFYDTRSLGSGGWAPALESVSDSRNAAFNSAGTGPQIWVAVGDFQIAAGDTANFNQSSTVTVARDDGKGGDAVPGDGILTYRFRTSSNIASAQYKFAAQGATWTTKFGIDGWSYDPEDSANGTFSAAAGQLVTLEFDTVRGHLRSSVTDGTAAKLLLTEVVSSPTDYELVELYNPNSFAVDLSDYYLSDYPTSYEVVKSPNTAAPSSDFLVRFPKGASIPADAYQTVSLYGAECFTNGNANPVACPSTLTGLGVLPTYELTATSANAARNLATVPDMVPPFSTAVGSTRGLTNTAEPVILFFWDGLTDLVTDVDMMAFGSTTTTSNLPPNKSGVSIDGPDADATPSTYAAETAFVSGTGAPQSSNLTCRQDFVESGQVPTGGNGVGGRVETSENWSQTWRGCQAITVNAPTVNVVEVTPPSPSVNLGATVTLTAAAFGDLGKTQPISSEPTLWSTTPIMPTTFTFDPLTAVLTGVAVGNTERVTARIGGRSTDATVSVTYASITISCDKATLPNNGTANCTAQAFDSGMQPISGVVFAWDIAGGTSATVDSAMGVVTGDATATGLTLIRARGANDPSTQGLFSIDVQARTLTAVTVALVSACPSPDCLAQVAGQEYRVAAASTLSFTATGQDQFGDPITLGGETWTSSDPMIAPAPTAGMVTVGVTNGVTGISVTAPGATANVVTLIVEGRVATAVVITAIPANNQLVVGGTAQLAAAVVDQFGATMAMEPITWASDYPAVATVDMTGLLTGQSVGTASISAHSGMLSSAFLLTITPAPKLTSITVLPGMGGVEVGKMASFTAQAFDQFGAPMTGIVFSWSSSAIAVATVDMDGVATGIAPGVVTLSASAGSTVGMAQLTVSPQSQVLTTITLTPPTAAITVGDEQQFTATPRDQNGAPISNVSLTWTSSNDAIASIDQAGLARGVSEGRVTLTAAGSGNVAGTAELTIHTKPPAVATVALSPAMGVAKVGETMTFTAVAKDAAGVEVPNVAFTWSAANTEVAEVDGAGVATAKALGTVVISASAEGRTGSATLTVQSSSPVVASIEVAPFTASIQVGTGQQFTARALDSSGAEISGIALTWSSNDTEVAPMSADGFATGRSPGQATVTAAGGGQIGTASLVVTAKTADGCGCAAGSGFSPSLVWGFALALIPLLRRRRVTQG